MRHYTGNTWTLALELLEMVSAEFPLTSQWLERKYWDMCHGKNWHRDRDRHTQTDHGQYTGTDKQWVEFDVLVNTLWFSLETRLSIHSVAKANSENNKRLRMKTTHKITQTGRNKNTQETHLNKSTKKQRSRQSMWSSQRDRLGPFFDRYSP